MIYKLLLISVLGALFIVYADHRAVKDPDCTKAGYMCKNCSTITYCVELAPGNWLENYVSSCKTGSSCLQSIANCTTLSNPECPNPDMDFVCNQPGIFPDPYDCFMYHICKNKTGTEDVTSIKQRCVSGFSYDPMTTRCRIPSVNSTCDKTVPDCTSAYQSGAVARNPSLYFVCVPSGNSYHPQIFSCLHGMVYNGTTCVERAKPKEAAGADGKCPVYGYFYDPANCHSYYGCGAVGAVPVHYNCNTYLYFNTTACSCINYVCADYNPWRF